MATSRLDYGFTEFYWEGEVIILLIEAPAESAGLFMVPGAGVEPARYIIPRDFKSLFSLFTRHHITTQKALTFKELSLILIFKVSIKVT